LGPLEYFRKTFIVLSAYFLNWFDETMLKLTDVIAIYIGNKM